MSRRIYWLSLLLVACGDTHSQPAAGWQLAFDASAAGWLLSAWGSARDDMYAAGGREAAGVLMHDDGAGWQPVPLPSDVPLLNWVFGFARDEVTVVGNAGTILHFDGSEWTRQSAPTEQDLWGVWGIAAGDLWAVGGKGSSTRDATLLHFDGAIWSLVEVPPLQRTGVAAFYKVWGTAADDVYVVGQRGVVLHYDGSNWSEQLVGASDDLISLWGAGRDAIVAIGGRGVGIASLWDGGSWRTQALGPLPGLNGVWVRDSTTAYVAGNLGTLGRLDLGTLEVRQEMIDTRLDLHSVFGLQGRWLFAVGGNFFFSSGEEPQGVALVRALE